MGKRGPKPKGKVKIKWSSDFAYAIGLLVTDGSLSKDGRHISFVSQDAEQVGNLLKALKIQATVGRARSGYNGTCHPRVQIGDVLFWKYLVSIGLMSNKSKVIGAIDVPSKYFFGFLRGHFDGDGSIYAYWDRRWKSSYMFYTVFVSASKVHISWLQKEIQEHLGIHGHVTHAKDSSVYQLRFAKAESLILLKSMYKDKPLCLGRKRLKIAQILRIVGEKL